MQHVVIVAAGRGSRFGAQLPKQFCTLGGRPVLMHTIERMRQALPQARIALVLNPDFVDLWHELCAEHSFASPMVALGGDTRWQSVKNALAALSPEPADMVLVHDGVRPNVDAAMVARVVEAASKHGAAIPAVAVTDSLRQLQPGGTSVAVDRSTLSAVQTPQAFRADALVDAYRMPYRPEYTDDASVYEAAGNRAPALVEGSPFNIKITHPLDIEVAALYMGIEAR